MCDWVKSGNNRIDPCLRSKINKFRNLGIKTLACCCGHGVYPETIVFMQPTGTIMEYNSGKVIPRKRRFYRRDKNGVFFIPEVCK